MYELISAFVTHAEILQLLKANLFSNITPKVTNIITKFDKLLKIL